MDEGVYLSKILDLRSVHLLPIEDNHVPDAFYCKLRIDTKVPMHD